ncbi:MAG: hypothetical protein NC225_10590 [Clostridium sp.]|nr:hypothetical protein [Clostridium sp.]MCM1460715.1 hypothetical protein [Bacteroides sp.]
MRDTFKINNNTFGGIIYSTDFHTDCKKENKNGSTIAQRIISDKKFDKQCMNNIKNNLSRKGMKNYE